LGVAATTVEVRCADLVALVWIARVCWDVVVQASASFLSVGLVGRVAVVSTGVLFALKFVVD